MLSIGLPAARLWTAFSVRKSFAGGLGSQELVGGPLCLHGCGLEREVSAFPAPLTDVPGTDLRACRRGNVVRDAIVLWTRARCLLGVRVCRWSRRRFLSVLAVSDGGVLALFDGFRSRSVAWSWVVSDGRRRVKPQRGSCVSLRPFGRPAAAPARTGTILRLRAAPCMARGGAALVVAVEQTELAPHGFRRPQCRAPAPAVISARSAPDGTRERTSSRVPAVGQEPAASGLLAVAAAAGS